jgi:hypothetical protein
VFSDEGDERRGDGRRRASGGGAKDNKKKRGRGAADRGRHRRDGEGLRAPRARGFYDEEDEGPAIRGRAVEPDEVESEPKTGSSESEDE